MTLTDYTSGPVKSVSILNKHKVLVIQFDISLGRYRLKLNLIYTFLFSLNLKPFKYYLLINFVIFDWGGGLE